MSTYREKKRKKYFDSQPSQPNVCPFCCNHPKPLQQFSTKTQLWQHIKDKHKKKDRITANISGGVFSSA